MLHNRVLIGSDLYWIRPDQQTCPLHGIDLTKEHIWIRCEVAVAVWQEASLVWPRLGSAIELAPTRESVDEMMALTLLSPCKGQAESHRWQALYQTATRVIWKAFLSWSFASPQVWWQRDAVVSFYRSTLWKRIMTERAICMMDKYRSKRFNDLSFQAVSGQLPQGHQSLEGPELLETRGNW